MRPLLVWPTRCPDRPTRWSPCDTALGDSSWTTRSTLPISIPSCNDGGPHQRLQAPCLQVLLHLQAGLLGHAAVVRTDRVLVQAAAGRHHALPLGDSVFHQAGVLSPGLGGALLVQPVRRALGHATAVGEDQGGPVLPDEVQHPWDEDGPEGVSGETAVVIDHGLHQQIQGLVVAGVHDGHRPWAESQGIAGRIGASHPLHRWRRPRRPPPPTRRPPGSGPPRPEVGWWPRARSAAPARRASSTKRSRVRDRWTPRLLPASVWISSTTTVRTVRNMLPRPRTGQHQVQGLGRGDQHVGRSGGHGATLLGRRIPGAHRDADLRQGHPGRIGQVADPRERHAQVAVDVVVERLQRRDVDQAHAGLGLGRPRGEFPEKDIDPPQECRECLAGAGGREDERVLAALDGWPASLLGRRGPAVGRQEPVPDRWGEGCEHGVHQPTTSPVKGKT